MRSAPGKRRPKLRPTTKGVARSAAGPPGNQALSHGCHSHRTGCLISRGALAIPARLQREQLRVAAVQLHLLVAAVLDDAAAGEDRDLIGHAHRGEAVRDEDGDALARELAEVLEHLGLRLRIHGGGRLIEHEDIRAGAHEGARQGDLLPLAAGELAAVAEPLAELGAIARGQRLDELARPALHRRRTPALLVLEEALIARPHVLAHQHLVAREVLEDDADPLAERYLVPIPEVLTVEDDSPGAR